MLHHLAKFGDYEAAQYVYKQHYNENRMVLSIFADSSLFSHVHNNNNNNGGMMNINQGKSDNMEMNGLRV